MGLHCVSKMLLKHKQTKFIVIGDLRVNIEQVLSHSLNVQPVVILECAQLFNSLQARDLRQFADSLVSIAHKISRFAGMCIIEVETTLRLNFAG